MGPIRVVIADDHPVVRDGLRRILELEADDDVALCNYVAAQGFALIDQEEREAELRETRRSLARQF